MSAVSRVVLRHKRVMIVFWLVVLVAGGAASARLAGRLSGQLPLPGTASYQANQQILRLYGNGGSGYPEVAVVRLPPGQAAVGPVFLAFLAVHVPAGLTAVISGALAATAPKRRGRHTRAGTVYYWAITAVFATAVAMTAMRPARDWYLALLGALTFLLAATGRHARRHPRSWPWRDHPPGHIPHIIAMGGSYTVLLTAFYVDNGKNLPLWDRLPTAAYWLLPAAVAAPLIWRSVRLHRRPPSAGPLGRVPLPAGRGRRRPRLNRKPGGAAPRR